MPYRPTRFNATVGLDLKWVKDAAGKRHYFLNILDLATTFNIGIPVADKTAEAVKEAFKAAWLIWAGGPSRVVVDRSTEYYDVFAEYCDNH